MKGCGTPFAVLVSLIIVIAEPKVLTLMVIAWLVAGVLWLLFGGK